MKYSISFAAVVAAAAVVNAAPAELGKRQASSSAVESASSAAVSSAAVSSSVASSAMASATSDASVSSAVSSAQSSASAVSSVASGSSSVSQTAASGTQTSQAAASTSGSNTNSNVNNNTNNNSNTNTNVNNNVNNNTNNNTNNNSNTNVNNNSNGQAAASGQSGQSGQTNGQATAAPGQANSNTQSNSASGQAGQTNGQDITASGLTDTDIFNFALSLEQLELAFYQEGLNNFTASDFQNAGLPAAFYNNLQTVASHEQTHVSFLEGALGGQAVQPCTYDFPSTDPASFLQFAAAIEAVGVSAYLGASPLISSKNYLTEAGSILTVEARHTAYIRYARSFLTNAAQEIPATERSPFPSPFDIPLSPSEAYTIASRYIVECPQELPFVNVFPLLTLVNGVLGSRNDDPLISGSVIELRPASDFQASGQSLFAAFPTQSGPIFAPATQSDNGYSTIVPAGINGQAYVVLVNAQGAVTDETIVAGPAVLQINNPTV